MAYTNIDDPSKYFQTTTFSSSGSAAAVTNGGNSNLQPDWVWSKGRSMGNSSHDIWDSSRGVNSTLFTSANEAEDTGSNRIVSFNSDGFNYGAAGNHQTSGD